MKSAETFLAELEMKSGADLGHDSPTVTKEQQAKQTQVAIEQDILLGSSDIETLKKQIENRAVAMLAMREHGAKELKQKLLKKFPETPALLSEYHEFDGFVSGLIDEVLEICQQNNWQNDERYLEQAVRSYSNKGQGPLKIRQKLQQACNDAGLINIYLDWDESDWVEIARQVLDKKYGNCQKPTEVKEQAKRVRFLQSRGFLPSTVWKAFK